MKARLKHTLFRLLGKDPDAVVVSFLAGDEQRALAMLREMLRLVPDREHYAVSKLPLEMEGVTVLRASEARRRLRRKRIALAPVLFDGERRNASLRWLAFSMAPSRILAFNKLLERHHLRLRTAVASFLFLRGVPLDRIYLRPSWLMPWKSDRSVVPDRFRAYPGAPARTGRRRIAVLSPYAPFPLAHGGAVRLYNLLQQAAAEFDLYLVFFSDPLTDSQVNALANIAVKTFVFDRPRYREPRWSSLRPPEVNEFDVPAVSALLKRLREQEGVELVQVEYTQLATYTADVLVEHDVTFDLYEQIHTRQPSLQSWWDLFRWRRFERGAVRNFRSVIVMSEKDRLMLGIPRTTVVPNGVDLERFRPTADHGSGNVLFVGSFSHFPNIVAFRFLTEEIWPAVIAHCPQATLTVVAGPDADLHWTRHTGTAALPEAPRAAVHGFVADVRPLYEAADVVVVPTRVSAGTNLKVLEAMAAGRALVTTPSGCGGIPLEHGVSALIAGDGEKFASAIASLLNDGALRAALAREARTIAEREFGWDALGKRQREVWRNLLGREHVHLRPGRPGDLGRIGEIEASSGESAHWEPETYLEYELTVATMNGTVAGFMVTRNTVEREREILNIAVAPEFRRRGVASALIHGVNAGDIFLEVRESNHAARALYRKLGFAEVGFRPGYYDNPPETAVVMRLTRN